MPDPPPGSFRVDRVPRVDEQIQELARVAKAKGIRASYIKALKAIHRRLTLVPQEWGDPEYHTQLAGGVAYHGVYPPLLVHFIVYEASHWVCILDITPLPNSGFD
jgi:hypothetical protein